MRSGARRVVPFVAALTVCGGVVPPSMALAQAGTPSPHGPGPLPVPCTACHTTASWSPARQPMAFSHGSTGFALTGAHARVTCDACHIGLRFDDPPGAVTCDYCHADIHRGRLSSDCRECHDTDGWRGERERARAHMSTSFPLTGAHLRLDCDACHLDEREGAFAGLDPSCRSCHAEDFRRSEFPDHVASGYSQECRSCHSTATWRGARFDHSGAGFLLIGAHTRLACASCHQGADRSIPWSAASENDCVACHRQDYDREHGGSGFPTDCTICHTPNDWEGGAFEHDARFFPITSGPHRGTWETCQDCHPSPGSYSVFTCITCHTRTDTDGRHAEVGGYVYESTACYSCHPRGKGDDD